MIISTFPKIHHVISLEYPLKLDLIKTRKYNYNLIKNNLVTFKVQFKKMKIYKFYKNIKIVSIHQIKKCQTLKNQSIERLYMPIKISKI